MPPEPPTRAAGGNKDVQHRRRRGPGRRGRDSIERLGNSIRGKLQFKAYLVRAAITDLDRCVNEPDPDTGSFLRQLVEMHASSLAAEAGTMRLLDDLDRAIEPVLDHDTAIVRPAHSTPPTTPSARRGR